MPPQTERVLAIRSLKGGRNGADPPSLVPNDQCLEALNVDWNTGAVGRKRPGSDSISLSGGTAFSTIINALIRHLPSADETASELWAVDGAGTPKVHRLAGGTTWADVTMTDNISSRPQDTVGASFNGKLFLAFKSAQDRLHVYDPVTSSVRRVGLATTGTPTAATSAGAVTDTRTYKTAVTVQASGITQRRSELSAASSSTVLAAQRATVTLVSAPGEGETHWELYGASTDGVYKLISTATIGTATQVDNNASLTGTLAPLVGTNSLFPSVKYIIADDNRIVGANAYETTTGKFSRVWFTPPFVNPGDDERNPQTISQTYYIDINENDGGFITGLGPNMQGSIFVFKYRQVWKLTQSGSTSAPYAPTNISRVVGCIEHKSIVMGRDEHGQPALYWLSAEGPYRYGAQGLQYMGRDVEDLWKTINLDASNKVCHGVYYSDLHQVWWWIALNGANDPNTMIVYDTILGHAVIYPVGDTPPTAGVRRGWAQWTGDLATARCSVMFAKTIGASMSRATKPYAGFVTSLKLLEGDSATATDDAGTPFQSYLDTKPYDLGSDLSTFDADNAVIWAKVSTGTIVQITYTRDYGAQVLTDTVMLTAREAGQTRTWRKFEKFSAGNCFVMQIRVGDPSAQSATWTIDKIVIPSKTGELLA